ncbi:MAG: hypothetical protein SGJ26_13380, partial [Nitrospirota bacterium]|nr:hypothetical protein [Nitrospirota bacterium]
KCARITFSKVPFLRETKRLLSTDYALFDGRLSMEVFEIGKCRDSYVKPRDAARILRENDLSVAVGQCSELKALVNTILSVCGGAVIP